MPSIASYISSILGSPTRNQPLQHITNKKSVQSGSSVSHQQRRVLHPEDMVHCQRSEDGESSSSILSTLHVIGNVIYNRTENCSYCIEKYLGKGGFAECFAVHDFNNKKFALKIVEKMRMRDPHYIKMNREIDLQMSSRHVNIVRLYGSFSDDRFFYLVMELCRTETLLSIINRTVSGIEETRCRYYMLGILHAVEYLIANGILHRDLKPGNIMIGFDDEVKVGDFGLAIRVRDLDPKSISGTPNYLAPEILRKMGHSERSEVWSLGCMLFCMLTKRPPFETDNLQDTYTRIKENRYSFPANVVLSDSSKYLIRQCLHPNRMERPSIADMLRSDWMQFRRKQRNVSPTLRRVALSRAKSVTEICLDFNDNLVMQSRPRSSYESVANGYGSRSAEKHCRRRSVAVSHDSGFGSEADISRRPIVAKHVNQMLKNLHDLINGKAHLISSCLPDGYVTKWVDYSNRHGFCCKLSDGSATVKFNDGACLNLDSDFRQISYASSPFASPRTMDECEANDDTTIREHVEEAHKYMSYMDSELAGIDPLAQRRTVNLLVFHKITKEYLLMVLSDGTVQINFLLDHIKVILWRNRASQLRHTGLAILDKNRPYANHVFSIQPMEEMFISSLGVYNYSVAHSILNREQINLLSSVRSHVINDCDFLSSQRKPIFATEC